jgi:hypothetical protein
MANLIKMYLFSFFHFYQMPGTVTFGTNTDNDRLAIFLPNGIIRGEGD